jgi:hypothetical protein
MVPVLYNCVQETACFEAEDDRLYSIYLLNRNLLLLRKETIGLPSLLREIYSHWFSEHYGTIALRLPSYRERRVEYAVTKKATYSLPTESGEVSLQKVMDMLPDGDELVLGETALSTILKKFEFMKSSFISRSTWNGPSYLTLFQNTSFRLSSRIRW